MVTQFMIGDSPHAKVRLNDELTIKWSDISGLDFQYSPLEDVTIVLETRNYNYHHNSNLSGRFYFLLLSKVNSSDYFDEVLLKNDKRLYGTFQLIIRASRSVPAKLVCICEPLQNTYILLLSLQVFHHQDSSFVHINNVYMGIL
jgi:hypothetical protein